jgi:hypothetical protein
MLCNNAAAQLFLPCHVGAAIFYRRLAESEILKSRHPTLVFVVSSIVL